MCVGGVSLTLEALRGEDVEVRLEGCCICYGGALWNKMWRSDNGCAWCGGGGVMIQRVKGIDEN